MVHRLGAGAFLPLVDAASKRSLDRQKTSHRLRRHQQCLETCALMSRSGRSGVAAVVWVGSPLAGLLYREMLSISSSWSLDWPRLFIFELPEPANHP